MSVEVIKQVGSYYNVPVGPVCYNTDKVLTTVLNKQSIEGFATIVLKLASTEAAKLSQEQKLLSYQWLEHIAMYASQAAANPAFAQGFLKDINKALEKNTYLTGQSLNVTDIAAFYVLYPLVERLSVTEQELLMHVCRWIRHIQAQPRSLPMALPPILSQLLPHQLKNMTLDSPILFHPQPFTYPGYPVVLYL